MNLSIGKFKIDKTNMLLYNQVMDTKTNETDKRSWGGARKGAGRPKVHKEEIPARTLWLRATDDEWAAFLATLPADAHEKFLFLSALASAQGQGGE